MANGKAKISASVFGVSGVTKIHARIVLQKYAKGAWSAVKVYEETEKSSVYSMSKSKAVSKGKYHVKGVYTLYKGGDSEKTVTYSNTYTYV